MKTEHEKLFEICEKIGYEEWIPVHGVYRKKEGIADVREVIFTESFMEEFNEYYINNIETLAYKFEEVLVTLIYSNLHDPVEYLHKIINKLNYE